MTNSKWVSAARVQSAFALASIVYVILAAYRLGHVQRLCSSISPESGAQPAIVIQDVPIEMVEAAVLYGVEFVFQLFVQWYQIPILVVLSVGAALAVGAIFDTNRALRRKWKYSCLIALLICIAAITFGATYGPPGGEHCW